MVFLFFIAAGVMENICREKLDLGFVLDSSGSIGAQNFEKIKTFVKNLTDHFKISRDYTRVSIISYATSPTLHFPFSRQFADRNDLHSAIENITYSAGNTYTGAALTEAYTDMFNANNGARLSGLLFILNIFR